MQEKKISKNIFVVDDDASIGEILKMMLEEENYDVLSFTTGQRAIESISDTKPDLVILDYFLMGENFSDVYNGLRHYGGDRLPIILMSANKEARVEARKNHITEFIEKPFQRELMLRVVARNIN